VEPAEWLGGKPCVQGTLSRLESDSAGSLFAIVALKETVEFRGTSGSQLVLRLRYRGAVWKDSEVVHVQIVPATSPSGGTIPQAEWVESHATYRRVAGGT
jgi:hypothetical protein